MKMCELNRTNYKNVFVRGLLLLENYKKLKQIEQNKINVANINSSSLSFCGAFNVNCVSSRAFNPCYLFILSIFIEQSY